VCLPSQLHLALAKFPDAKLHWFDRCGHFPQWDAPAETVRLILDGLSRNKIAGINSTAGKTAVAPVGDVHFQE